MSEIDIALLKKISDSFAVLSDELDRLKVVEEVLQKVGMEYIYDAQGNLIAGNLQNPTFAIAAHADEVGVRVTNVRENGLLEFETVGYIHQITLHNSHIQFKGKKGMVEGYVLTGKMFAGGLSRGDLTKTDLVIDIGAVSAEEVLSEGVEVGTLGTYSKAFAEKRETIMATGLDNGIGIYVAIDLLKNHKNRNDLVFVFHVGEESGSAGAKYFQSQVFAPYSIVLDYSPVGFDTDYLGDQFATEGQGPTVVYGAANYTISETYKNLLEKDFAGKYQICYMPRKGEIEVPHFEASGSQGISVTVPARGFHGANYIVRKSDVLQTIEFVGDMIQQLTLNTKASK